MEIFLERRRHGLPVSSETDLAGNLEAMLRKANEFVPSAAGSILLDNPLHKKIERSANQLTFLAAFGDKSETLIGHAIPAQRGIAGHVYQTGEPYYSSNVASDQFFFPKMDNITAYSTRSLVAVPVRIAQNVCGVLELINRHGSDDYTPQDRNLLQIFAGYISVSIQNILDARRAQELARRDNLTGLYNDHHLHLALSRSVSQALEENHDLAVLFLDLDFFKRVNDTHGHLAGSQVLREVGALLGSQLDDDRATVARYGGDEFVLVAPHYSLNRALDLAEEIRQTIVETTFCEQPGDIQPEALHLTGISCSVGVATLGRHVEPGLSVEAAKSNLVRLADTAMYVAKETGRNRTAVAGEPVRRRVPPPSRY